MAFIGGQMHPSRCALKVDLRKRLFMGWATKFEAISMRELVGLVLEEPTRRLVTARRVITGRLSQLRRTVLGIRPSYDGM